MVYDNAAQETLRRGGQLLGKILSEVADRVAPGVSTIELDTYARERIEAVGGTPSFLGYTGGGDVPFPSTLCISVNNEVVHGTATPERTLKAGDIVGIDIGMRYPAKGGLCTDTALTVAVGAISHADQKLVRTTQDALERALAVVRAGATVRDIGKAVQSTVEGAGYAIVRDLVGHGVGTKVHEAPEVPNFVVRGPIGDYVLSVGEVIAIEPMVNAGGPEVVTKEDEWTIATRDGSRSAHFEHTVLVTEDGVEILTKRPDEEV